MLILLGLNTCDRYGTIHGKNSKKHFFENVKNVLKNVICCLQFSF